MHTLRSSRFGLRIRACSDVFGRARVGVAALLFACAGTSVRAQSYAITYQGELRQDGELVDGIVDIRCRLYQSATGNDQIMGNRCFDDVEVVGGRFTITFVPDSVSFLDFQDRYLELEVRPGESGTCDDIDGYDLLGSRQLLTSTPFALVAQRAETADSTFQLGGLPFSAYARLGTTNTWTATNSFSSATITSATLGSATLSGPLVTNGTVQIGPFNSGTPLAASSDASNPNVAFFTSFNTSGTVLSISNAAPGGRAFAIVNTGSDYPFGAGNLLIRDVSAASDRIAITQAGNVGLGTNNPLARLDVNGSARVANVLTISASQGTAPLAVTSTTKVDNLNADRLDDIDSVAFARRDQANTFGAGNTFSGLQVNGDLTVTQNIAANSLAAQQGIAALAPQGMQPLTVVSNTKVNNLNADLIDGVDSPQFARRDLPNTFGTGNSFAGLQVNGDLAASQNVFANAVVAQQTIAALAPQGVAPFQVASTFKVNNLNVDLLDGVDSPQFARRDQPNTFGLGNTFAGLQVNGDLAASQNVFAIGVIAQQVAATAPQGTAPLIVSSTTKVTNLNADLLDGVAGAGYARLGGVNNFANDNTFNNVNVLGDFTGDTVAANTFALRNTAIRTLTIPAFAFQTDGQIPYFRGAHELRGTSAGTVVSAYAAVQLPNAAKIESISYNFFDNGSSDLTLVLRESSFSAIPLDTPIVVLNTSGAFPAFATNTHNFPTPYPVVDNTTKSYYLSLTIPVPATPANLRIGDVHIQYLVDELAP